MIKGNIKSEGFKGEKAIVTPYVIRDKQSENLVSRQLYVTHIGYYPMARYHFRERTEGTPENILIFCESGAGWVQIEEERVPVRANQFCIIPAGLAHAYGADAKEPWSIYWLHFKGESAALFSSIIGKVHTAPPEPGDGKSGRLQLFDEIYKNLSMGYSQENLEYITYCLLYFLATLKYIPQYQLSEKQETGDVIQQAIHFMKKNLEEKITLHELAEAVGYSPSHLNTLFTKSTSFSPIEYFNQLKIQRVCYYLQFSDLKIKEIAFKLGFYDPFHLSKAFLKEMGLSPKLYRAKYNVTQANSPQTI